MPDPTALTSRTNIDGLPPAPVSRLFALRKTLPPLFPLSVGVIVNVPVPSPLMAAVATPAAGVIPARSLMS